MNGNGEASRLVELPVAFWNWRILGDHEEKVSTGDPVVKSIYTLHIDDDDDDYCH